MELIILLILVGLAGYFLAWGLRGRQKSDSQRASSNRNTPGMLQPAFIQWATGPGGAAFPQDFKLWLISLNPEEAAAFCESLDMYAGSLGFSLTEIESGSLVSQPALFKTFVEVVVIYSNTFRKAREALQQAKDDKSSKEAPEQEDDQEILPAEKNPSRRKQPDMPLAVPAGAA